MCTHPKTPCSPSSANESEMNSKLDDLSLEEREKEEMLPQPQTRLSWKENAKREKYEIDLEKTTIYGSVKFINKQTKTIVEIANAINDFHEATKNLDIKARHLNKVLLVIEQERQKQQQQQQ